MGDAEEPLAGRLEKFDRIPVWVLDLHLPAADCCCRSRSCLASPAHLCKTFFSGFGLGTLLMPLFALYFPIQTAIAATAIVHLANNLFKLGLVGRAADWSVVARFGIPAASAAVIGAGVLVVTAGLPSLASYQLAGREHAVTPVKVVVGLLIVIFAVLETIRRFASVEVTARHLPWGGVLAGFFGGLSGTQGALRSAFLIKAGLSKHAFVATGVVCAVLVDVMRLLVYGGSQISAQFDAVPRDAMPMAAAAVVGAFGGALVGARVLKELTLSSVQRAVSLMMVAVGLALMTGLL